MRRDASLTHFEYLVLAKHALRGPQSHPQMSALAQRTNATLPRLSHVVRRLGDRGFVDRTRNGTDARATNAHLTEAGLAHLVDSAPGHVEIVRERSSMSSPRSRSPNSARSRPPCSTRWTPEGRMTGHTISSHRHHPRRSPMEPRGPAEHRVAVVGALMPFFRDRLTDRYAAAPVGTSLTLPRWPWRSSAPAPPSAPLRWTPSRGSKRSPSMGSATTTSTSPRQLGADRGVAHPGRPRRRCRRPHRRPRPRCPSLESRRPTSSSDPGKWACRRTVSR